MSLPSQAHGGRNIPAPSCQGTPCSLQSRDGLRWGSGGFGALLPHFPWEGECFEVQLHFVHKSWVSVQDVLPQSGLCESAAAGLCLEQWWQVAPCPSVLARALQSDGHSSVAQLCLCRAQPGSNRALVPVIPPSNLGVAEPREDRAGLAVCPQGWLFVPKAGSIHGCARCQPCPSKGWTGWRIPPEPGQTRGLCYPHQSLQPPSSSPAHPSLSPIPQSARAKHQCSCSIPGL